MSKIKKISVALLSLLLIVCCVPFGAFSASAASSNWVGAWGTPAIESGVVVGSDSVFSQNGIHLRDYIPANSTIRSTVTPTLSGTKIRLKFSNIFGKETVTINEVTVGVTGAHDDEVLSDTITQITFNGGQTSVNISAGSEVYSDEVNFKTTAMQKISISAYFKNSTPMYVVGLYGGVAYLGSSLGNRTHKATLTTVASKLTFTSNSITYNTIPFLTRVDVYSPGSYCVVLLGDSTVTNESYLFLAKKLHANNINNVGVIMSGIIGNSLLHDGKGLLGKVYGQALLTRANRDAFEIPGTKYVIVKIGDNDILHPMTESLKGISPEVTTGQILQGYRNLADQVYGTGINLYLCTRTPYKGYERNFLGSKDLTWSQTAENKLVEINSWVKYASGDYYDGSINLDAMRDPDDSTKLRSHMTTDGIHFSELGQIAFVDLIPEAAYGVNHELKNLSAILNKDPYVKPEPVTKAPEQNNADSPTQPSTASSNTPTNNNVTLPNIVVSENTTVAGSPVQEILTVNNAQQIFVDNAQNNQPMGVVDDNSNNDNKQIVGFAVLAVAGMMIVAIAAFLLIKNSPTEGSPITRKSMDRLRSKSRV